MSESNWNAEHTEKEDKRIRRIYQNLLLRRTFRYWNIIDFPYLAEVVRHDSRYLRKALTYPFVDHPALSQYLTLISLREVSRKSNCRGCCCRNHSLFKLEMFPIGLERTLFLMYKRQMELSDIWGVQQFTLCDKDQLPILNFQQFVSKINGGIGGSCFTNVAKQKDSYSGYPVGSLKS